MKSTVIFVVFIFMLFFATLTVSSAAAKEPVTPGVKANEPPQAVRVAQAQGEQEAEAVPRLEEPEEKPEVVGPARFGKQFEERILELGTKEKFEILERQLIKDQILTFIPPLLQPAVGNSAFVLPPGVFQFAVGFKFTNLDGDDFFLNGDPNPADFDSGVRRQFLTASFRMGFDLDRKYLHSFTAVLNVPFSNFERTGTVNLPPVGPGGSGIQVDNSGDAQGLGNISLFIKKKLYDQANENRLFGIPLPLGVAIAAGVFFPSGDNDERAGTEGRIAVCQNKNPSGAGPPPCSAPGRAAPLFGRFTDDGRFPAGAQPSTDAFGIQTGLFFTKQFVPGDLPGFLTQEFGPLGTYFDRAALHWGAAHRINFKDDGIDPGDKTTLFAVGSIPVYKDFLSLQINSINTYKQWDSYKGNFCFPNDPRCSPFITPGEQPSNPEGFPRPSFSQGWTSLFGPGFIFSPDPQIRLTATGLFRIKEPNLGPAPPFVVNFGTTVIF